MSDPLLHHPSLESSASVSETAHSRPSLFDTKDSFIDRVAPIGMAAIYFGSFSLAPQDAALSRQALFKLSFLHRYFLEPAGLRVVVQRQTAIFSGKIRRPLLLLAEILAHQIEGIELVKDETESAPSDSGPGRARETEKAAEVVRLLFATDQTLRSPVQIDFSDRGLTLEGQIGSASQKSWAEQLAESVGGDIVSRLAVASASSSGEAAKPPKIDDESLQALVLFRLRLIRETEHLPLRVKASAGIVSLQGKARTEALRQKVENIARSTIGLVELRSTLSLAS